MTSRIFAFLLSVAMYHVGIVFESIATFFHLSCFPPFSLSTSVVLDSVFHLFEKLGIILTVIIFCYPSV